MAIILCNLDNGLYNDPRNIHPNVLAYLQSACQLNDLFFVSYMSVDDIENIKPLLNVLNISYRYIFTLNNEIEYLDIIENMNKADDIGMVIDASLPIKEFCFENDINFFYPPDVIST